MKNKIWIIVVSLLVFVVGIWYINKSLKRNDGNNFEGGKPPIYLYYMNLCKKDGGQIEKKDQSLGSFNIIVQWKCVCTGNLSEEFEGRKLACNQWFNTKMENISN